MGARAASGGHAGLIPAARSFYWLSVSPMSGEDETEVRMLNVSEAAASQAALAIIASLLQELKVQKVLTPQQIADTLNRAVDSSVHHPEYATIKAAIHSIAGA